MDKKPVDERSIDIGDNKETDVVTASLIGDSINPALIDLPDGIPMSVKDGNLQLNARMFPEYRSNMEEVLRRGIIEGDEKILQLYIDNVSQLPDKAEVQNVINALKSAFETRSMDPLLSNLVVEGITNDIAQRNLIRKGIEDELTRNPLKIIGHDGKEIPLDDLDIVFTKDDDAKKSGFKFIIGSKKGIDGVELLDSLEPHQFQPDYTGLAKDKKIEAIIVPLKKSKDGTEPSATKIQIIKSPINLASVLAKQEREREEEDYRRRASTSTPKPSSTYHYASS